MDEPIRKMVRRIVRRFAPDKIILFGSHARGDAGPDSDVERTRSGPSNGPPGTKGRSSMPSPDNAAVVAREWIAKVKEAVKLARGVRREILKALEDKPLF
jgi:hypothetical protein